MIECRKAKGNGHRQTFSEAPSQGQWLAWNCKENARLGHTFSLRFYIKMPAVRAVISSAALEGGL
jgi:hypothetical protein